jgi:hypothetical protein
MERDHHHPAYGPAERAAPIARLSAGNAADRVQALPAPGPFEHRPEPGIYPSEVARAFATTILVMYPVIATVAVVLVSLFLTGGAPST